MNTPKRIYRTDDDELVLEGHPTAAFLAYGVNDEVENRDEKAVEALLKQAESKQAPKPANKQAPKGADK